jgi:hypothetical protein
MTGLHAVSSPVVVATQGSKPSKGEKPLAQTGGLNRHEGDEELWSKLESKLSERDLVQRDAVDLAATHPKRWFQYLFQGRWIKG